MPPGQSKAELYAALRRDAREGMSNRALERKYRVGWRTVQKALSSAWPQPREPATLVRSTYGSRLGYPRCRRAVQASFAAGPRSALPGRSSPATGFPMPPAP